MPASNLRVRRAVLFLTTLSLLLTALNILFTLREVGNSNRDRCASLERLVAIPLPPRGNPARPFAAAVQASYRQRAIQLGCPEVRR